MHLLFLQQLLNGIQLGSIYALIALGYTMVYGILRLINFAHADVFMIGAYITFYATNCALDVTHGGTNGAASLGILLLLGVLIERLAYKPVRNAPRLTPLITAIGVSLFLENFCMLPKVFGAGIQFTGTIVPGDSRKFHFDGVEITLNSVVIIAATLLILGVLWYVVSCTKLGKAMRAVSFDRDAASLMGIDIDRVISFTFFVGSGLAGAAAFLFASLTHHELHPDMGIILGMKAFVAAVLGGIGNIPGAALGGLIMGLAESFVQGYAPAMHISPSYSDAVSFLLLIFILLVKPSGLFGSSAVEKV
jgi:branched-chain amino acid transport system permease protein